MFSIVLHVIPGMVSFVLLVTYFISGRKPSNPAFPLLCLVSCVYFSSDAIYVVSAIDYNTLLYADMSGQFLVFMLLPTVCYFLYYERFTKRPGPIWSLLYLLPFLVLGHYIGMVCTYGADQTADYLESIDSIGGALPEGASPSLRYFFYSDMIVSRALVFIELLAAMILLCFLLNQSSGRFKHICASLAVMFGIGALRASVGRFFLVEHQSFSVFLSLCIAASGCMLGFLFFFRREEELVESEVLLKHRFLYYMNEKKIYRDTRMGIDKVARLIGTNRVKLSAMIAHEFGTTFREYVKERRSSDD